MPVKVLGQILGSAASATTIANLIPDPSFESATFTARVGYGNLGVTSTNTYQSIPAFSNGGWLLAVSNNTTTNLSITTASLEGETAPFGSRTFGIAVSGGGQGPDLYFSRGINAGQGVYNSNTSALNVSTAIPVTGDTTYFWGFNARQNANSFFRWQVRYAWWTAAGTYINDNFYNASSFWGTSFGGSGWQRYSTQSITAPSNAAFATIEWGVSINSSNNYLLMDGFTFTTNSTYNTTFVEPTNSTYTAPFTSRLNPGYSGTVNNSTSIYRNTGTQSNLYTTPAGSSTVVSTLAISNTGTSSSTYRVAVVPNGETLALRHWLAFDNPIGANSTTTMTLGITLAAGDRIVVQTDSGFVNFSAFGNES